MFHEKVLFLFGAIFIWYKVNCNDCEASYVGESKRGMGVRIPEHERDSKKVHKETPFFKHMINTEHTIDFAGSQILIYNSLFQTIKRL